MENEKNISEKTRRLTDTYLKLNNEGRNILDIAIQKLKKAHGNPEKIERIRHFATIEPFKDTNEEETN